MSVLLQCQFYRGVAALRLAYFIELRGYCADQLLRTSICHRRNFEERQPVCLRLLAQGLQSLGFVQRIYLRRHYYCGRCVSSSLYARNSLLTVR